LGRFTVKQGSDNAVAVKSDIEKKDKNIAVINLEIPSDQTQQEYNKACRRLSHRINIPGFRRGKAPRAVIEKNIGPERIRQEALDQLLPHAFADAISEHQLDIVAPPIIDNFKFDLDQGVKVKASVELRPDCKLPDFGKIKVDVPEFKLPADAEQTEINLLLERMTTLEPVINRDTVETDIVNIDFAGTINGEAIKGGTAKNYRLDLAHNNFIEGFAPQLIGKPMGKEFTINVTFPADYHDKEIAGKPAAFKIKINEIKEKKIPELNDELAKKVGNFDSVADLKKAVQTSLEEQSSNENTFRKQKALIEAVVAESSVEISDTMIAREVSLLRDEIQNRLKSQGLSWDQFVSSQGQDKVLHNLRKEATQRIKTSLVFGSIAKENSIQVEESEFAVKVKELAEASQNDEKYVMRQLANTPQAAQSLNDQILSQKIVDFLSDKVTFSFVEDKGQSDATASKETTVSLTAGSSEAPAAAPLDNDEFEVIEDEA